MPAEKAKPVSARRSEPRSFFAPHPLKLGCGAIESVMRTQKTRIPGWGYAFSGAAGQIRTGYRAPRKPAASAGARDLMIEIARTRKEDEVACMSAAAMEN